LIKTSLKLIKWPNGRFVTSTSDETETLPEGLISSSPFAPLRLRCSPLPSSHQLLHRLAAVGDEELWAAGEVRDGHLVHVQSEGVVHGRVNFAEGHRT